MTHKLEKGTEFKDKSKSVVEMQENKMISENA